MPVSVPEGFEATVPGSLAGLETVTAAEAAKPSALTPDIDLSTPARAPASASVAPTVSRVELAPPPATEFQFAEPSRTRSHIDGLPLHPIQRGVPDFEPPVPRDTLPPAAPVSFDGFDEPVSPVSLAGGAQAAGGGSGLKWAAIAAVVIAVCGAAGWFGYQYVADRDAEGVPAVAAEPAGSGLADGEAVVSSDPGEAVEAAQTEASAAVDAAVDAVSDAAVATPAEITPAAALNSDKPVPVTVEPVHVLQDSSGGNQTQPVAQPARPAQRKPANRGLDNLLD